jgi:hypothetical protein
MELVRFVLIMTGGSPRRARDGLSCAAPATGSRVAVIFVVSLGKAADEAVRARYLRAGDDSSSPWRRACT